MRALDKKLLRDFRRLWAQSLAIALVLAAGVAILVLAFGTYRSLVETRDAYYERNRFADVFALARSVPRRTVREIGRVPGVAMVEARIEGSAVLDIEGLREPAVAKVISLPRSGVSLLNVPMVVTGSLPGADNPDDVAVSDAFAKANGFVPGDTLRATMGGQRRNLRITGTLISPEFIYTIGPDQLMPDDRLYGIVWMSERAAAAAFDLQGGFNNVALKLTRDARPKAVIDKLDGLLKSAGGAGAFGRSQQISHAFLDSELKQLKSMAWVVPPIFFTIAAFLVNMVLGRIITLEREQIGLLKAIGYANRQIAGHYLKLALAIALFWVALGWAGGAWMGRQLAMMYSEFFRFPYLIYVDSLDTYAISALAGIAAAVFGALRSIRSAARLTPAVAMSPPAPTRFRQHWPDRLGKLLGASQPTMMIVRSLTRWPMRAAITCAGIASALAVLISSLYMLDSLDVLIERAFFQSNRQNAVLALTSDRPLSVLQDAGNLPGVLRAEGIQVMPVRLRSGPLSKLVALEGRNRGDDLGRVLDYRANKIALPDRGIVLSERLAKQLGLEIGDRFELEFLTGRQEVFEVPLAGTVQQYLGLGAYADAAHLSRLLRQKPFISKINLSFDPASTDALYAAIKGTPGIAGISLLASVRQSFRDTISQSITAMIAVYTLFGILITVGVAYNSARIQLSERGRELASLRILGFTRAEVSYILVGEMILLTLLAIPPGWLAGTLLAAAITRGFESDLYALPFYISRQTYGYTTAVVLASSVVSAFLVRRRLDRMDLVSVMKTRE